MGVFIFKMAKCKNCDEKLKSLISNATATTGCRLYKNGELELDNEDLNSIAQTDEWRCPNCDEVIAMNEDEAREFLEGEE